MLLDKEKRIIPHLVDKTPTNKDELLDWAKDVSTSLNTLNRLIVDQFNGHIVNPYAHSSSWKASRTNRNYFYNATNASTSIIFPATTKNPLILTTGETRQVTQPNGYKAYSTTSNVTCNLANTGINGIDTGAIAANKVYYFYAVVNGEEVGIIASLNDPLTGPTGYNYGEWLYQGAASTNSGAAKFPMVMSSRGRLIYGNDISNISHTGTTTHTGFTFVDLPTTAKFGFFRLNITGTVAGTTAAVTGSSNSGDTTAVQTLQVSGIANRLGPFLIPLIEPQKIYVKNSATTVTAAVFLQGWLEDPTEFA